MPKPKLTRLERTVQRDYLESYRADYPNVTAKELRAITEESTRILLDARSDVQTLLSLRLPMPSVLKKRVR